MTYYHSPEGPHQLMGLARVMQMAFDGHDLNPLYNQLHRRIHTDSSDAAAMLDMSLILQLNQQSELAEELQWQALQLQQHYRVQACPHAPSLRVLALMTPGSVMDNTPIEFLVGNGFPAGQTGIQLDLLYVGRGIPTIAELPEHDVAFVAVCESSENQPLLLQLAEVMRSWPKPYVNEPRHIAQLSRDRIGQRLRKMGSVVTCRAQRHSRANLLVEGSRLRFPVVIRPVDSHAGHGLRKLVDHEDLQKYLSDHAEHETEFFVTPFIDYRSADGLFRKYRVAVVGGRAFPAHMAVSPRWMVHYLNADMLNSIENRRSEEDFMNTFDAGFGLRHAQALREIDARLGLDYYSLDCAETADGRLLVFEIDSGAVIHAMDPVSIFPYKQPHMHRLFAAFHALLSEIAGADQAAVRRVA